MRIEPHILRSSLSATVLASTLAIGAAHGDVTIVPITTIPASDFDYSIILSGDGTTVVRSYATELGSPPLVTRWKLATGTTTFLPPPAGSAGWYVRSVDETGANACGITTDDGWSQARVYSSDSNVYYSGFEAYTSATIGPSVVASAFASQGNQLFGYIPGDGFWLAGILPSGTIVSVDDSTGSPVAVVGSSVRIVSGAPVFSAWVTGAATELLPTPAPDVHADAALVANDGRIISGTSWRTLPDGTERHRLVRWTIGVPTAIEPAGGATDMRLLGESEDGRTIVLEMLSAAGSLRPETIWDDVYGFMTADEFLVSRGYSSVYIWRIWDISDDGRSVVASSLDGQLYLIRGLYRSGCGNAAAGSCFTANATPFCSDAACCDLICDLDSFCCSVQWDAACRAAAQNYCAGCGDPAGASCFEPHASTGCSDESCCAATCSVDPYCCENEWDSLCADRALAECRTGDTCAQAKLLSLASPNSYLLTTTGVPADGVATPCGVGDTIGTWRILRATCSGITSIRVCTSNYLTTQGVITVYEACGQTPIACSADSTACPQPFSVSVDFFTVAGEEYLVRFSAENGGLLLYGGAPQIECQTVCGAGGPCGAIHGPGCDDSSCCEAVCSADPYCCTVEWDQICVNAVQTACAVLGDLNGDGVVNAADLSILLSSWGLPGPTDLNGDGSTGAADLAILLDAWG